MENFFERFSRRGGLVPLALDMQPFAAYTDYQFIRRACSFLQPFKTCKMQPFAALFCARYNSGVETLSIILLN